MPQRPKMNGDSYDKKPFEDLDPTVKLGLHAGKQILQNSNITSYFSLNFLKPYFDVNNKYVLHKIKNIIAPFLYKTLPTQISNNDLYDSEEVTKDKLEFADLYLPLMSFITYILVIAFNTATINSNDFNPEILGMKATKNFFILIFYSIILKGIIFVFCNYTLAFLDCLAYVTYKFVLLVINVLFWIVFKRKEVFWITLIYTIFMSMIFMHKTLNARISKEKDIKIHQKMILYIISTLEIFSILLFILDCK